MADDRRRDESPPADPAEGVRIIGAEEAAEAIERGDVASRRGTDLPRYGDRPARPPAGPKPALRFPLDAGADTETPSLKPAKGTRFDPRPPPAWDDAPEPDDEGDPWPAESTWGVSGEWDDETHDDVVAWSTGAHAPVADAPEPAEDPALAWADDFVDEDDPWDGTWDEPTGAVAWADDAPPAAPVVEESPTADVPAPTVDVAPTDPVGPPTAPPADLADPTDPTAPPPDPPQDAAPDVAPSDRADADGEVVEDDWAAFADDGGVGGAADDDTDDIADSVEGDEDDAWAAFGAADEVDPVSPPASSPPRRGFFRRGRSEPEEVIATDEPEAVGHEAAPHDAVDGEDLSDTGVDAPTDDDVETWDDPSWGAAMVDDDSHDTHDEAEEATDPVADEPAERTGGLFDEDGGWADEPALFDFADEPSGQVDLPHWTEPATGELPAVFAGPVSADVPSVGVGRPSPHWRQDDRSWGDDGFDDLVDDDEVRVGALDDDRPHEDDLYTFAEMDDIEEPAPAVEEPPAEPIRRRPPARPAPDAPAVTTGMDRRMGVAVGVGVGLAAAAIVLLVLGAKFAVIAVVAVLVVAMGEFQAATQRAGYRPAALLGLVAAAAYPLAVYYRGIEAYPLLAVLTIGAALAWHLTGADGDARVVESVGVTLFGVAWIAGLGSFAALLLALPDGRGMFVTAVLAAVAYDVGGLLIGRSMGTKALSDASPNKTIEGLVGGMLVSMFVVLVIVGLFGLAPWDSIGDSLKIALIAALAAPLGDLCESLVKRDLGVKDMGDLLPEHGGLLDRFDGLLFVLPAVFYGAMLFGIHPF